MRRQETGSSERQSRAEREDRTEACPSAHTLHTRAGMGSAGACHPKTRSTGGTAVDTEALKHVCLPMYLWVACHGDKIC